MSLKQRLITELFSPDAERRITAAMETAGLGPFRRDEFTELTPWTEMFGTTAGPYPGIGGAALTEYRLAIVHSPAVMLLFADKSHQRLSRFCAVEPFDAAVVGEQRWQAFTVLSRP